MFGLDSYSNTLKDDHRIWSWDSAARLLSERGVSRKKAICLFLLGPEPNREIEIALSKGFRKHNLIGADIDYDRVNAARKAGIISIQGEIADLIAKWPDDLKLSYINADFCGGLDGDAVKLRFLMASQGCEKTLVVTANMLRGRDGKTSIINFAKRFGNEDFKDFEAADFEWASGGYSINDIVCGSTPAYKHRGVLFFMSMRLTLWYKAILSLPGFRYLGNGKSYAEFPILDRSKSPQWNLMQFQTILRGKLDQIIPSDSAKYHSYANGCSSQYMDSVTFIFKHPCEKYDPHIIRRYFPNAPKPKPIQIDNELNRRFNALKAVRTKRINAE